MGQTAVNTDEHVAGNVSLSVVDPAGGAYSLYPTAQDGGVMQQWTPSCPLVLPDWLGRQQRPDPLVIPPWRLAGVAMACYALAASTPTGRVRRLTVGLLYPSNTTTGGIRSLSGLHQFGGLDGNG